MIKIVGRKNFFNFVESKNLFDEFYSVYGEREWDGLQGIDGFGGYCNVVYLVVNKHPLVKKKGYYCTENDEWEYIAKSVGIEWFIDQTLSCLDNKFGEVEYTDDIL